MGYGTPDVCLGTNIRTWRHQDTDEDETHYWSISGYHYDNKIVTGLNKKLISHGINLNANWVFIFTIG